MNILKYAAICSLGIALSFLSPEPLQAQCTNNTQSTNTADAWLSCEMIANPNTNRGVGHWLLYNLGYTYGMGTTTFWNYNIEGETGKGFKEVAIDYSLDGIAWTEAGVFQLAQAPGSSDYAGVSGLDLTGINARYILITALSTWNGGSCAGLSEVRFHVNPSTEGNCGDIEVTGPIGGISIATGTHYSDNSIFADGIVEESSEVVFQSANSVTLTAGFEVKSGGVFEAKIEGCTPPMTQNKQASKEESAEFIGEVEDIEEPMAHIFPNPAAHYLTIQTDVTLEEIMIVNSAGHEISRVPSSKNIDVSFLPNGMYFLKLVTIGGEVVTRRFIKQ